MRALLDLIDDDTTIITVNRRLARAVLEAYAGRAAASGRHAWRTPDVLPFGSWVERSWRSSAGDGEDAPALLRLAQERLLWEQVVRRHPPPGGGGPELLAAAPAARRAQEAFALVHAWRIPLDAREFGFSEESRAFRDWAGAFDARCARGGWIDAGRAAAALADAAYLGRGRHRRRAVFAGFEVVTAAQAAIRETLGRCGVQVADAPAPRGGGTVAHHVFDDPAAEVRAAAAWARHTLASAPASRIGVVVPDLHRMRAPVERIFQEIMAPGAALPGHEPPVRPFNLSYGEPMSRIPLVADALVALKLGGGRLALTEAGRLLRSPYIAGGDAGLWARAAADARLRDIGEPEVGLGALRGASPMDDDLRRRFDDLAARRDACPGRQPLKDWSGVFSAWLGALGWPGERVPDSAEYQAVEAFRGLLNELACLSAVAGAVDAERALAWLSRLADEQLFQPRAAPAPVQVLGVLESAGLSFDRLWVSGLHDGSWPPAPEPDPFIPVVLQRAAGVAPAYPEGQLELAGRRLRHWLNAADEVVLSHARFDGDEALRPSPVIAGDMFTAFEADDRGAVAFSDALNRRAPELEAIEDARAPALSGGGAARGGAGVIRDQAACPFRAFARWRLNARAAPVAASPLDARVRGNLVHAVLNDLWAGLRTRAALCALSEQTLEARVAEAVDRALDRERRTRARTLDGNVAGVERRRLCALAGEWLRMERHRPPFEVVAREQSIERGLGALTLSVRPDRVDRLEQGDHLVIDYKTGAAEVRAWFGDRPDDPQLAVYTLVVESGGDGASVAGAAYGGLKRGAVGLRGLAARADLADGVDTLETTRVRAAREVADWDSLKQSWAGTVEALAGAYVGGDARVDPKAPPGTCAFCEVMPLCRVFEDGAGTEPER